MGQFYMCYDPFLSICSDAIGYILGCRDRKLPKRVRIEFYSEKQPGTVKVRFETDTNKCRDKWIVHKGWFRKHKFLILSAQVCYIRNLMGMEWGKPFYLKVVDLDLDKAREVCMLGA